MTSRHPLSRLYHRLFYALTRWRYRNRSYTEFYSRIVDHHAGIDPKKAVGGKWEEIGELQFDFLREQGLEPHHTLLDVGCGCLRGGRLFIRYLEPGHYHGIDISPKILGAAREQVRELGLEDREPNLRLVADLELQAFPGRTFDFLLAQSVLTHMPLDNVADLLRNVPRVMGPESRFFATFWERGEEVFTPDHRNFFFPFRVLRDLATEAGLEARRLDSYDHPRRQQMMELTLANSGAATRVRTA